MALLARNRVRDRMLDRWRDRLIVGQADCRIGVVVERESARICVLPEQYHGPTITILGGKLAHHGHASDVGRAFAKFGIDRSQHVTLTQRIEDFRRTYDFEIAQNVLLLWREDRRPAQAEILEP